MLFDCQEIINNQKNYISHFFNGLNHSKLNEIIGYISNINFLINKIIFLGVGKNENLAIHFTSLFNSININSISLSALNCLHGDIGIINTDDLIIILSNSGNTVELLNILPFIKKKTTKILGFFSNNNAKLIYYCNIHIILPKMTELDPFNCIPTSSILSYIICFNIILTSIINIKNISKEKYAENHPNGYIGLKCNALIRDIMLKDNDLPIVYTDNSIKDTLFYICEKKLRCCIIKNKITMDFIGIVTDGNIRRYLSKVDSSMDDKIINCVNDNPIFFYDTDHFEIILDKIKQNHSIISCIPIKSKNGNNEIVGLITHDHIIDNLF